MCYKHLHSGGRNCMRTSRTNAGILPVIVFLIISLFARAALGQEKIRIAYPTVSMAMAPWWVAKEKGFFSQEGLDVDVMYIKGDGTIVQALIGGNIQAGYAGATPVAAAVVRGGPVVIVAVPANRMGYLLMTREPIKDPRDLY